jgi:hypothetical protein
MMDTMTKPTKAEVLEAGRWMAQCAAQALMKLKVADAAVAVQLREAISEWQTVERQART